MKNKLLGSFGLVGLAMTIAGVAILIGIILVAFTSCAGSPAPDTKPITDSVKVLAAQVATQQKALDTQQAAIAALAKQTVALQGQVDALAKAQTNLVTKAELAAIQTTARNVEAFGARLAAVEGAMAMVKSQQDVDRARWTAGINSLQGNLNVINPATFIGALEVLKLQVANLSERLAAQGW